MASAQGVRSSNPPLIWREILRLEKAPNLPTKIDFPETCYFCELDDLETFSFFEIFYVLPQSSGEGLFFSRIRQFSFRIRQYLARIRSGAFVGLRINLQSHFWAPDQPPDGFFRMTEVGRFNLKVPGLAANSARSCKIHSPWRRL